MHSRFAYHSIVGRYSIALALVIFYRTWAWVCAREPLALSVAMVDDDC